MFVIDNNNNIVFIKDIYKTNDSLLNKHLWKIMYKKKLNSKKQFIS